MKNKLSFYVIAIVIIWVYFGLCSYMAPSQLSTVLSLVFCLTNLVAVLLTSGVFLRLLIIEKKTLSDKIERATLRDDVFPIILTSVIIIVVKIVISAVFAFFFPRNELDYSTFFELLLADFVFVFIAYKLFRLWLKILASQTKKIENKPKTKIDRSAPLLPILWIGDKDHYILTHILSRKYQNIKVWDEISWYYNYDLEELFMSGIIITCHSDSTKWEEIIDAATIRRIQVILLTKDKSFGRINKLYKGKRDYFSLCKTDNNWRGVDYTLPNLIENKGKRG